MKLVPVELQKQVSKTTVIMLFFQRNREVQMLVSVVGCLKGVHTERFQEKIFLEYTIEKSNA